MNDSDSFVERDRTRRRIDFTNLLLFVIGTIVPLPTHQPWVYLAVCVLLGGVGLLAVLLPAPRGSCLDPMEALRHE